MAIACLWNLKSDSTVPVLLAEIANF